MSSIIVKSARATTRTLTGGLDNAKIGYDLGRLQAKQDVKKERVRAAIKMAALVGYDNVPKKYRKLLEAPTE